MGSCPRWFRLVEAARYLGTTPWDLENLPWRYVLQAEEAQAALRYAERVAAERAATR